MGKANACNPRNFESKVFVEIEMVLPILVTIMGITGLPVPSWMLFLI